MGKGGSAPTETKSTVTQTNLPEYVRPYFERLLQRTEAESQRPYQPFEGQRIADVSQDLLTSEDRIRGIADQGLPGMTDAMDRVRQGMDFKARQFTGDEVSKYMSPYMDQVVARQKQSAIDDYRQQLAGGRADAISAGAFGGSREGVQRAERETGLQQAKADTLARLLSSGFAQSQKAAQEAGRLSGGIGQAFGTLAGTTSDIGRLQQALGQADVSQLSQLGAMRQAQQQAQLDAQRQNLMQAAQEPFTRLQLGQNLLQGMPSASIPSTFTQATQPAANPFLQGIGAYTTLSQIAPFSGGPTAQRG